MNEKPQPKREIGIEWMHDNRIICLYATKDALEDLKEFGTIHDAANGLKEQYWLLVDARYDFQEVVDYIKNYG
jgi:hypothetical protein